MRERIRFLFLYYIFWVVFFIFARILFLIYHVEDSKNLTLEMVFGIFSNGIVMDFSMAAYYSLFPFLWVTFSNFIDKGVFQNTIFSYTFILLTVTNLIIVADLEVFNTWNFRLDATPLKFLTSPRQAFISVKGSPLLRLLLSYLFLVAVGSIIVYRIVANKIYDWKHIRRFPFIIYGLLLTAALIIPIRGGFGKKILQQKTVYFSHNYFANVSALNAPWNFGFSLLKKVNANINPYTYLPKDNLDKIINSLFVKGDESRQVINRKEENPNVIVILLENFTDKVLDQSYQGKFITPGFNELRKKGIYFENFYAAADRTDKTVLSILSGYPAQPKESILDFPEKLEKLPVLSKSFNRKGYSTQFYYGGDASFLTLKPYLFLGNFEQILEKSDFPSGKRKIALGVPDEDVYTKFLEDHKIDRGKPFFSVLLTLSGHEPFEIPGQAIFDGRTQADQFYNALNYSDQTLMRFLNEAEKEDWWKNTLVVIVGNHGHKLPETRDKTENFKVPMLWTGGVVGGPARVKNAYGQTDIATTLLAQLGFPHSEYNWSRNIFNSASKPWAFFTFNDGFGYVNNKNKLLFDNVGRMVINDPKLEASKERENGKALQQRSFQDFLNL